MKDLDIRELLFKEGVEIRREVVEVFKKKYLVVWLTHNDNEWVEVFDGAYHSAIVTTRADMPLEQIKQVIAVYYSGYIRGREEGERDACK